MTLNDLEQLSSRYIIPQVSVDFIRDSYVNIPSKQMDNARYVLITCTENGIIKKINPLWSAFIRLKKSDENIVYNSCEIINETGQVLVTLTEQILAASGKAKADIQFLTDENMIYSTKLFYLDVGETPYNNNELVSTYEFNAFNSALSNLGESIQVSKELIVNAERWEEEERIRQENESKRKENESNRSEVFEELKTDMETEINNALEATEGIAQAVETVERASSEISELATSVSTAEEERKANEIIRIENENQRIENENNRINAENARANALTELSDAITEANSQVERLTEINNNADQSEVLRKEAENARVEAELLREENVANALDSLNQAISDVITEKEEMEALSESVTNAENSREESETLRQEEFSSNMEELQSTIEESQNAISSITSTEESVTEAESIRVEEFNELKAQMENAINNSNTSIENVNKATEDAISAGNTALESANKANELVDSLETSLNNVNTAIEEANEATERAIEAAKNCEDIVAGTGFISINEKGNPNGVATLDEDGKISSTQLPSYVDDVLDGVYDEENNVFLDLDNNIYTPESSKIYVDVNTKTTYRWSGSTYVAIGSSLALGETSSTAYYGDKGKVAYEHSQSEHARIDATKVESSDANGSIKINDEDVVVYEHPTGSGNNHIPSGGEEGQVLTWNSDGEAIWKTPDNNIELPENIPDGINFDEANNELQLKSGDAVVSSTTIQCSTFMISATEPPVTNVLWIDSSGIQRYYNGSEWKPITAVWG